MNPSDNHPEAIAIVGMAGRFPLAPDLDAFWRNLRAGVESVSFFAENEIQWLPFEPPPRRGDPSFVPARAVLERPEWFDAAFFGMNPREAAITDPQHRVFLECAWEALEDAACDPETFPGAIGVFAGASLNSYLFNNLLTNRGLVESVGFFPTLIANGNDFLTTRVSYKLNLRGPSINVQTACSTSLVAVCLAAQHVLSGRCDAALAGGVSITFPPRRGQHHVAGGIMSDDGHCRAFDARATGTVLGDGAGVVVLKRLGDALAAGDRIRAVIRGTAINNDGSAKIGFTAPSSDGQAEVIATAQAEADFSPESVGYIEAHGTGTPLGDPIEIEGLRKAFGIGGERGQYCSIGSVKTNIGHLDITAGVAGLIKTVLALEHREIPPSLHFSQPNPKIEFEGSPFEVASSLRPWPRGETPRRAGVSSFGIGGTNAHVALEEAPALPASSAGRPLQVLTLSARTGAALDSAASALATHLEKCGDTALADVAWTLQTGRRAFEHRRAWVCRDITDAVRQLRSTSPAASAHTASRTTPVAFLFPGQGAQHLDMGRSLHESEPVFRTAFDECCRLFSHHLDFDLSSLLLLPHDDSDGASQRLTQTAVAQPALFAVEYSLARLWMAWGIRPCALIGHSLGEYTAACVAGVFALEDAVAIVAARARLMQRAQPGAMLAVSVPADEAASLATGGLSLAAVNAPGLCVLSGPAGEIDALASRLGSRGVATRRLATSHAFHSSMMDACVDPLRTVVQRHRLQAPSIPLISNVTGGWLAADEATDPAYWSRHLRSTVRFADGLATLVETSRPVLLEAGPGRTLLSLARRHPATGNCPAFVASLPGAGKPAVPDQRDADNGVLDALASLWCAGAVIDWRAWHGGGTRLRVPLPTYPFQRERCWIEPGRDAAGTAASGQPAEGFAGSGEAARPDDAAVVEPAGSIRSRLADLFASLSGHDYSNGNASVSFHELGLDSLMLTQASFALDERFGRRITMRQLTEELTTLDKLAAHLGDAGQPGQPETPPAPREDSPAPEFPLTPAQRELWYVSQLGPALSSAYNESFTLRLDGNVDRKALRRSLVHLAERHESLRMSFLPTGERQRVSPEAHVDFEEMEANAEGGPGLDVPALVRAIQDPFDLTARPPWRVRLVRVGPSSHLLVLASHHLIADGWSLQMLVRELGELYSSIVENRPPRLAPADSFSEYAAAEAGREASGAGEADSAYWMDRFRDAAPPLEIPTDRPRPASRTFEAGQCVKRLARPTVEAIHRLVAGNESSPFTVLFAAFAAVLHRLSGQDDIVVGVPAAAQVLAGRNQLAGHCVNLLPIRTRLRDQQSFPDFLKETRGIALDAFEHWQHPLSELLRRLNLPRETNRVPLASVTFNVGRERERPGFSGLEARVAASPKRTINFDLRFNAGEDADGYVVDCHFSTELFDTATIERLIERWEGVLRAAAAEPLLPVTRLPMLTPDERRLVLVEWNRTDADYPRNLCLHELFEAQAARTPESTAIIGGSERWSYRRLNAESNRIAERLRALGVRAESAVGICAARTPATVAAVFGILKAGGAYVPLDPSNPPERLAFISRNARLSHLVTDRARTGTVPDATGAAVLDIGSLDGAADPGKFVNRRGPALPGSLAYVIHTSGSTGRPKGVAIEHRSAVTLVHWARDVYSDAELRGVLAATSLSFDLSVFEMFVPLAWGGAVILAENALEIGSLAARSEVTLVNTVPSAMQEILRLGVLPGGVRTVNLAGEPVSVELVNHLYRLPHVENVYDLYGPTEDTVYSTGSRRAAHAPATIGRPISNTRAYILDRRLEPVPPGTPGELCLAGEGLARGYLHDPVLTESRFVRNPLSDAPAARLYRTGDLARHRPDGMIEFLGRMDHQVKVRGYRIEPAEIEEALRKHPAVSDCVVVARRSADAEKTCGDGSAAPDEAPVLAAYVVLSQDAAAPDASALRSFLARNLPDYMIPSAFVKLEQLPLTATGKIDRRALPAPQSAIGTAEAAAAPRSVTEEIVADIWRSVLRVPSVGIHDNFFSLGGHSLLVTQMLARVQQRFLLDVPLRSAFEAPTVARFAEVIDRMLLEEIQSVPAEKESPHVVSVT